MPIGADVGLCLCGDGVRENRVWWLRRGLSLVGGGTDNRAGVDALVEARDEATMALASESPVFSAERRRGCIALYVAVMLAEEVAADCSV